MKKHTELLKRDYAKTEIQNGLRELGYPAVVEIAEQKKIPLYAIIRAARELYSKDYTEPQQILFKHISDLCEYYEL